MEAGGSEERRTLAFRDYLREQCFDRTRLRGGQAASEFIARAVERALAFGYPREL